MGDCVRAPQIGAETAMAGDNFPPFQAIAVCVAKNSSYSLGKNQSGSSRVTGEMTHDPL